MLPAFTGANKTVPLPKTKGIVPLPEDTAATANETAAANSTAAASGTAAANGTGAANETAATPEPTKSAAGISGCSLFAAIIVAAVGALVVL